MVLPNQIAIAAEQGDVAAVEAWLKDEGNDVNDLDDKYDATMLINCLGTTTTRTAAHNNLVRLLIEHGADVDTWAHGNAGVSLSALHFAYDGIVDISTDAVSLLLDAKANVHCRTRVTNGSMPVDTPLGTTLYHFQHRQFGASVDFSPVLQIVIALLRAGASLDNVTDESSAETSLREAEEARPFLRDNETFA